MHLVLRTDEHPTLPMSSCFLATGRSCLAHLIGRYNASTVFMPWMVPEGLIQPFERAGIEVKHYELNADLSPNIDDVAKAVEAVQPMRPLIVVVHYFGFLMPTRECAAIAHQHGGLLLEDCAHCLASPDDDRNTCGDMALYSFNKILPVPDGALLFSKSPDCNVDLKSASMPKLDGEALNAYRAHLAACRILAASEKPDKWFRMAEKQADAAYEVYYEHISHHLGPCCPSDQAVRIAREVDFGQIVKARRKNAEIIRAHVRGHDNEKQLVNPGLPIMVFPIISEDRDALSDKLLEQGFQSNVIADHWRAPPVHDVHASYFWKKHLLLPLNEHMKVSDAINIGNAAYEGSGDHPGEKRLAADGEQKQAGV